MPVLPLMNDAAMISWLDSEQIMVEKKLSLYSSIIGDPLRRFFSAAGRAHIAVCGIAFDYMHRQRKLGSPTQDLLAEGQGFSRKIAGQYARKRVTGTFYGRSSAPDFPSILCEHNEH